MSCFHSCVPTSVTKASDYSTPKNKIYFSKPFQFGGRFYIIKPLNGVIQLFEAEKEFSYKSKKDFYQWCSDASFLYTKQQARFKLVGQFLTGDNTGDLKTFVPAKKRITLTRVYCYVKSISQELLTCLTPYAAEWDPETDKLLSQQMNVNDNTTVKTAFRGFLFDTSSASPPPYTEMTYL